jgi:hypothetical protein
MSIDLRPLVVTGLVVLLSGGPTAASDEPDETTLLGRTGIVKTGRLVKFVAKPVAPAFDLPDVPANDPTVEGASIKFYERGNPSNANTFALPALGWKKRGDPFNPTAFKYRGTGLLGDPCRKVLVKARTVRATCKGPDVTLNPPFVNGTLGVTLTIGTDSKRYCPVYGARRNEVGLFTSIPTINGGAPCSPSGAFVEANAADR